MSKLLANDKFQASLTAGYTVGQSTLSVSATPDNVPTIIVAAKGTDQETVFQVTGKTVNSLTGVSRLRGANVNLDATTPITCFNNEEFINRYQNAADTPEAISALVYAADGGSDENYVISLDPAPSEYVEGMVVAFKANTANTGPATLNVNSLGAVDVKKDVDEDLAAGDIQAGQVVLVVYDGTSFQLQSEHTQPSGLTVNSVASSTSNEITPVVATQRNLYIVTALAEAAELKPPTGTPGQGWSLLIRIKDDGTPRALTYDSVYRAIGVELPAVTVASKTLYIGGVWNAEDGKLDVLAVGQEG